MNRALLDELDRFSDEQSELESLLIEKRNASQTEYNECVLKMWDMRRRFKILIDRVRNELKQKDEDARAAKVSNEEIIALLGGVKTDE